MVEFIPKLDLALMHDLRVKFWEALFHDKFPGFDRVEVRQVIHSVLQQAAAMNSNEEAE